jgi:CHAT domain-containing protein
VAERLATLGAGVSVVASVGHDTGMTVFKRRGLRLASGIEILTVRPTPSWLLTHLPQFDHIFYAGHGLGARTGDSYGLILSDESGGSSILSVDEILTMGELKRTPLIYLSACETAEETGELGPELYSFASSLLRVGAGFVVGSLWRVGDEIAYEFTKRFYDALATLLNPSEAFCAALTQLRKAGTEQQESSAIDGGRRDDPTYWAPFVPFWGI